MFANTALDQNLDYRRTSTESICPLANKVFAYVLQTIRVPVVFCCKIFETSYFC